MPVTRSMIATVSFGASHELPGHPTCARLHGHQYRVHLTVTGDGIHTQFGFPVSLETLGKIQAIVLELRDRHLNDMIPAAPPSVFGISAYLLERTRILGVSKVEVHESDTNITGRSEYLDR